MSFRTEDKYIIYDHTQDIMHYLLEKGGKFLFPARKIISIYFDNENLEMFYDSEEGVVPRKKVRVRYYNNQNENSLGLCKLDKKNLKFETKINSAEGKFKIEKNLKNNKLGVLKRCFYDDQYELLKPVLITEYKRNYLSFKNSRATIDSDIKYYNAKNPKIFKRDERKIFEMKSNKLYNLDIDTISIPKTRFSKYCEGCKYIFNLCPT